MIVSYSSHAGYFFTILLSSDFFYNSNFSLTTIRVSNGLDPDHDRRSVRPALGPNNLQMLVTDDKSRS